MWFRKFGNRAKNDGKTEIEEIIDGYSEMPPPPAPPKYEFYKQYIFSGMQKEITLDVDCESLIDYQFIEMKNI